MPPRPRLRPRPTLLAAAALLALAAFPRPASAHFLWIEVEPNPAAPGRGATVRAFLAEHPVPEGPEFLRYVKGLELTVDGRALPTAEGEEALEARWAGALPPRVDARRDLGIRARGGEAYRLVYTARAQVGPAKPDDPEAGDALRARLVEVDGRPMVQVLFEGKPAAKARLKAYPEEGEPRELAADETGLAEVEGLAAGRTALWANVGDGKAGEVDGKAYSETRFYATLTYRPRPAASDDPQAVPTAFARMPEPAVNSFGGAVLDGWLYVYGGHVGRTHRYSTATTSPHFRRLNLADGATWEDLPGGPDLQGVALVSDGRFLYRTGGMRARNAPGRPHDMHSVADVARFDPSTKTWADLPPMPAPRSTHDAAVVGRTLYVAGGWTMAGASEESEFVEDTLALDLDRPESGWRSIPQPFRRRALAAAAHGGRLWVVAGLSDDHGVDRRVDVLDPATGTWTAGPELPPGGKAEGFGGSAFEVAGRLYASAGSGRIWRLSAACDAWEPVGAWSLPRLTHRLLPGPGPAPTLLAVGGNHAGAQTPVVELVPLTAPAPR